MFKATNKKLRYFWIGVFLFLILSVLVRVATYIADLYYFDVVLCNYGISFGIMLPTFLFWIIWGIILVVLICLFIDSLNKSIMLANAYILIITGGINNIIDRLIYGCVIDYIRIVPWNVFNLSDVFISTGVMIVLYLHFSKNN